MRVQRAVRWLAVVGLLWSSTAATIGAQAPRVEGTWEAATPSGGKITLVLQQSGSRVTGTLSGNGAQFAVEAEFGADGGFYGTARGRDGSLVIGGELDGAALGLALAELTAAGVPDMRSAQELRMQRVSAGGATPSTTGPGTAASAAPGASGTAAPRGGASAAPPANALAATPADRQLADLLVSSMWCNLQYSQQMGATTVERVVFGRDGRIASRTQRESAVNNSQGSYYGLGTDAVQGYWRVQGGRLQLSQDGRNYEPVPLTVSRNSNGYPIITTNNKEYYQCS